MKAVNVNWRRKHDFICNMPLVLLQFLIKEKVLGKYATNCAIHYDLLSFGDKKDYDDYRLYGSTFECFDWAMTKEGSFFWLEIDSKYDKYLRDLKK